MSVWATFWAVFLQEYLSTTHGGGPSLFQVQSLLSVASWPTSSSFLVRLVFHSHLETIFHHNSPLIYLISDPEDLGFPPADAVPRVRNI